MCKMEWTLKEKSLLESKLQESVNLKTEIGNKLKQIETNGSNQRNATFGRFCLARARIVEDVEFSVLMSNMFFLERCREIINQVIGAMSDHTFNSVTCSPGKEEGSCKF